MAVAPEEPRRSVPPLDGAAHSAADAESDVLTSLYGAVGKADGWEIFLDALARSYRDGKATLSLQEAGSQHALIKASGQLDPRQVTLFNQYYAAINPWMTPVGEAHPRLSHVNATVGVVRTSDQVLPRSELVKTASYNDYLRPILQVDQAVAVNIEKNSARRVCITVLFAQAQRGFDTVGRLQRLVPHIAKFVQLNQQLAASELTSAAAQAMLDGLAIAMMVVTAAGRLIYLNPLAEQIVSTGDGPKLSRMMLDAAKPAEGRALRQLVASAVRAQRNINALPGGVMRISRRSCSAAYEVLVAPIPGAALGIGFDGPLAAVFIRDPETPVVASIERLQRLYALTRAEARLMQGLLAGDTLDMISERAAVSRETLRSQLKAVFRKTGSGSQIELIRLGLRGLAAVRN